MLLAGALAELTWTILPQAEQAPPPPPQAVGAKTPTAVADYRRLANLHLFGQVERARPTAPVDAPDTRLNLTLRGILFNPNAEFARAIIASPNQPDDLYRVGDEIPGGATIEQIHPDRVILQRGGNFETLRLPEERLTTSPTSAPALAQANPSLPSAGNGVLSEYRRQIIENPQDAAQFLQAAPVPKSSGGIVGFRVEPGADPGMFQLAGLQPGDVVTAVNEVQLDSIDKGFEAIEELAASSDVTLKVLRNGQEHTVQLQLQNP